ncbi:mitogen-activated protein kinase 1 [Helicobacter phage FrMEG235U]|nr:mitogen-activated protein kinase 1 [Helicobacter phage FrMEG235U]ANT43100.1 mitogen-activated protein kinase 1 [Helicobacter phage FrANT170U]
MIKNLDFSFLAAQPKAFYSVINENLKEMFLKDLESEILKKFIKETIDNALSEDERLKALKLAELKALTYLQTVQESHKVKLMQDALLLEAQNLNNKIKIENEIAYNLKRKELIQEGKLDDEAFKKNIFKVI